MVLKLPKTYFYIENNHKIEKETDLYFIFVANFEI